MTHHDYRLQDLEELHRLEAEVEHDPLSVLDALRSGVSFPN